MEIESDEAYKNLKLKRIVNKIINYFAMHAPFLSGTMRAQLHQLRGVKFKDVKSVFIGENVYLDDLYPNLIEIGDNVLITSGTRILTHYIDTQKRSENPQYYFRFYQGKVIIKDNVFIGSNAIITKPITIESGSIIGANSVISINVPANAIVIGNPAKIVKKFGE